MKESREVNGGMGEWSSGRMEKWNMCTQITECRSGGMSEEDRGSSGWGQVWMEDSPPQLSGCLPPHSS